MAGKKDCVFCKIVVGEIKEEFLYEDNKVIVHRDIHPRTKTHILITSKKHFDNYHQMMKKDPKLLTHIGLVVEKVSKDLELNKFTWGFHSGEKQSINHLHAQLLNVENDELVL